MTSIELSAALGEGSPQEKEFWPRIRRAHVACGGPGVSEAIQFAGHCGVLIGVHLSSPAGAEGQRASLRVQIEALRGVTVLSHVRPQSTLNEAAQRDSEVARMIVELVLEIDPAMSVVVPHHSPLAECALARGLSVIREAHADRRYGPDGMLLAMSVAGSLLSVAEAVMQATLLARYGVVMAANGVLLPMQFDTLCVQTGDEGAVQRLQAIETAVALRVVDAAADPSRNGNPSAR